MKNNIKNIIIAVFSFVLLFAGQNVFGAPNSVSWNTHPDDCKTIAIANDTQQIGFGNPCWVGQNISANTGDYIKVRIYYHNNGSSVAEETRLRIVKSGSSTNFSFSGQIMSDSAPTFYSVNPTNVHLTIPANKTLDYVSTHWYPDQTSGGNGAPLLDGQNGLEILGSTGLAIGDILPDNLPWESHQGTAMVLFKVNNIQAPSCVINNFNANPSSITSGQSSSLAWYTSDCASVKLYNGNTLIGTYYGMSGYQSVSPTQTTTYTLRGYNSNGSLQDTKTVTVTVAPIPQACVINNFTASPSSITSGQFSTLSWSTSNCINVTLNNVSVSPNDNKIVYPTTTTTYTLRGTSSSGAVQTQAVTVTVIQPQACAINNFTANPTSINQGASSTLSWSTSNCASVTISNLGYNVPTSGTQQIWPNQTTTYTLAATGSSGSVDTRTITVTVNQPQACTINNFTANPSSITSGQSSTLSWSTSNCINVTLNNVGVSPNDSKIVYPTTTTNYVLRATGSSGVTQIMTVKVTVGISHPVVCNINNFIANPTSITNGQSSTLSWSTSDCASVKLYNGNTLINTYYSVSGSQSVSPTQTTTYTLKGYSSNGTNTSTKTVKVTVNHYIPQSCIINNFTASPTSINQGGSSALSWSTTNCHNVTISNLPYNVPTSGVQEIWPTITTTYILRAYDSNGSLQGTKSATVNVNYIVPQGCTINSFTASPSSITSGQSSTLSWNTSNCNSVSMGSSEVSPVGTQVVWPNQTTTYTLTASGSSGPAKTRTVTVYVDNNINQGCSIYDFDADPSSIVRGDRSILSWSTRGCRNIVIQNVGTGLSDSGDIAVYPTSTTTYILRATDIYGYKYSAETRVTVRSSGGGGGGGGGSVVCRINDFEASRTNINKGESIILNWDTTNCNNANISTLGNVSVDGSQIVYPNSSMTYVLTASRGSSVVTRNIFINVNAGNIYNADVVTTVATNITQNSALLNGLITNQNYSNSNVYFEYGTTVGLGSRTSSRPVSGSMNFSDQIVNLSPNTIYYFRAVGEGPNGVSRGAIEVFRTLRTVTYTNPVVNVTQPVTQTIVQGTTVFGSSSPIVLRIENKYQYIGQGDIIDYVVFYKNISSSKLTRPMIQVFIPSGISLLNFSRGTYSNEDRTLSIPLNDLEAGDEGIIYLQARVDFLEISLAQIVTTAILVYTNPNGAQENAMAYVLNNPKIDNLLGASAFFSSGRILGMNLIHWLLLIIFVMLLILLSRTYSQRHRTNNHQ
jgi:uncharacterized cysteine cluster protein YcgN (CxxCxxCC family)/disulfide bond formation protein DsbB